MVKVTRQFEAFLAAVYFVAVRAMGQDGTTGMVFNPSTFDSLSKTVVALDQKVKILERLRDIDDENNQKMAGETPVVTSHGDGFSLKASDNSYELKIRYEGHFDGRYFADSDTFSTLRQHTLLIRRARPIIEAKISGVFLFRIMADIANGKLDVSDIYLESAFDPRIGVRIGKFKSPFSLEVLQSTVANTFLELSLSSQLTPNRDIGLQFQGDFGNGLLIYAAGVFDGVADGSSLDADWNRPKDVAARIFSQPVQSSPLLKGLSVGAAITYGDHTDKRKWVSGALPASVAGFKTAGQESFFKYRDTTFASGNQNRSSFQGNYYYGSFGALGEYIQNTSNIQIKAVSKKLANTGWNVALVYALTGEANSFKGVKPFRNFDITKGQWGAFEIAARISSLVIDKGVFPVLADSTKQARSARDYTGGVNWYLNRKVKVLLDYTQTEFKGGAKNGNAPKEKLVAGRVQVAF